MVVVFGQSGTEKGPKHHFFVLLHDSSLFADLGGGASLVEELLDGWRFAGTGEKFDCASGFAVLAVGSCLRLRSFVCCVSSSGELHICIVVSEVLLWEISLLLSLIQVQESLDVPHLGETVDFGVLLYGHTLRYNLRKVQVYIGLLQLVLLLLQC